MSDLVQRLRGVYTVPINDGAGLLDGKDTFTRQFPVPPIHQEAADEIEALRSLVVERWTNEYQGAIDRILQLHIDDLQARLDAAELQAEHHQTMSAAMRLEIERLRQSLDAAEVQAEHYRTMSLARQDEIERLRALVHTCPKCGMNCIDCLCVRTHLHDCHGLLETAVDAMSTNGIGGCGLTPAWLDEAIRVIGWDDVDKEAGGDT